MIFVNFKTYEQGSGRRAVDLSKILQEVAVDSNVKIVPVVQVIDAETIIDSTILDVWIQHVDPISYGAHTGWVLPEEATRVGVKGVFLNHSEHKFEDFSALIKANARCHEVGLKTLIFAEDLDELQKLLPLKPNFISYEPPELVGSEEESVATAKPEVIKDAFNFANQVNIPLIVGAGIKSVADVEKSLEYGALGIAVSSAIVKSNEPKEKLLELVEGFE